MNLKAKTRGGSSMSQALRDISVCMCFFLVGVLHLGAQEVVYELVTKSSQLVDGGKYIIVDGKGIRAMGFQKENNRAAANIEGKRNGDIISGIDVASNKSDQSRVYELILRKISDRGKVSWGLYDKVNRKFLYPSNNSATKHNYMGLVDSLKTSIPSGALATITITTTTTNKINAIIIFPKNGSNNSQLMIGIDRSESPTVFSCYDTNKTSSGVALYAKRVGQLIISTYGYTTYTSQSCNYEMPRGCTGYAVTYEKGELKLTERYKAGDAVPAKTPLMIQGSEGTYPIYETTRDATSLLEGETLLHGEFDAEGNIIYDTENATNNYYYKLTTKGGADFGFYWGADNGAPFKMKSTERAYLVLPRQQSDVKGLMLDAAQVETAVTMPQQEPSQDNRIYDLSGRLCQGKLVPGIYVREGRKIVIRK